ncbi:P63C domain-containing protein [Corynebacterium accolens]|uniref:P63C domain-containing protein n=1 Tax=Corynebacterium accolens TaxID=38284 RepID=UPI0025436345|nr:P63C domain-containing protein [Corynebacterium accolens]MDK4309500.1 P63C domain-containing protein [Corynebacterium accolens]
METHRGKLPKPDPRKIAAQIAADKRWGKEIERATHQGIINIADTSLDCYVLTDGRRIISQTSIMSILGRSQSSGRRTRNDNRPPFLEANNLLPYITPELKEQLQRVQYRVGDEKQEKSGYNAEILPRICNVYMDAEEDGVLTQNQKPAAEAARKVIKALALVGITALVDEATGYQETRAKDELQRLLDAYIAEEFQPWVRRFPEAFFREIYRLQGWKFVPGNHHHPQYVGHFINKYIYEHMPEGVLERLRDLNPKNEQGNRARKHHQHLTEDTGVAHLERQVAKVITIMEISEDKVQFDALFNKAMSRSKPVQEMLEF